MEPSSIATSKVSGNLKLDLYKRYIYNGVDRVDSSKGYVKENVVPCCKWCNIAKGNKSAAEFKEHIFKMYRHMNSEETFNDKPLS
jgi:hypothetical protein